MQLWATLFLLKFQTANGVGDQRSSLNSNAQPRDGHQYSGNGGYGHGLPSINNPVPHRQGYTHFQTPQEGFQTLNLDDLRALSPQVPPSFSPQDETSVKELLGSTQ
eukprot:Lankesteria_metandrocarpae@DN5438_c0_g1_i4.p1